MNIVQMVNEAKEQWIEIFYTQDFKEFIESHLKFSYYSNDSHQAYLALLYKFKYYMEILEVVYYYPGWYERCIQRNPFRAHTWPERWFPNRSKDWNRIYVNQTYPGRTVAKIRGTLSHEYAHLRGFDHGPNNPNKYPVLYKNSVPYIAGKYVSGVEL